MKKLWMLFILFPFSNPAFALTCEDEVKEALQLVRKHDFCVRTPSMCLKTVLNPAGDALYRPIMDLFKYQFDPKMFDTKPVPVFWIDSISDTKDRQALLNLEPFWRGSQTVESEETCNKLLSDARRAKGYVLQSGTQRKLNCQKASAQYGYRDAKVSVEDGKKQFPVLAIVSDACCIRFSVDGPQKVTPTKDFCDREFSEASGIKKFRGPLPVNNNQKPQS